MAIVHYWLLNMRGGEKVVDSISALFPDAPIYTHVYDRKALSGRLKSAKILTTFIAKLPFARRFYQLYLPLMPAALEELDLTSYDLVISSESGPAKGVITRPDAVHICYCHSPMRYLWDQYFIYRKNASPLKRIFMSIFFPQLRQWDLATGARVDHFIANSSFVARRIAKFYRRDATIIHPPVEIDRFSMGSAIGDYYLCVGQLVRYKRVDLAVEAFRHFGRKLIVVGTGEELSALRKSAPPNVEFLGWQSSERIAELYRSCRALIFPGEEDFGVVPLEAMASGRPVIAYGAGGALDTIVPGRTGLFFPQQTAESLRQAVQEFETDPNRFDPAEIRAHAETFSTERFRREFEDFVTAVAIAAPRSRSH